MTESAVLQALVDASVRGLVIAVAVGLTLAALRIKQGSVRHAAWTAVVLAMLVLPIVPRWLPAMPVPIGTPLIPLALPVAPERIVRASALADTRATMIPVRPISSPINAVVPPAAPIAVVSPPAPFSWRTAVLLSWGLGAIAMAFRLLSGWWYAARLAAHSQLVGEGIYESPLVAAPVAIGVFRPRIILPSSWILWPAGELRTVRIHEAEHIRRRDGLTTLLAGMNICVFWFHPLSWWLERRIAISAEEACDDAVVRASREPHRYAETLLRMADAVRARGARVEWQGVGMAGASLAARIERVLNGRAARSTSWLTRGILVVICAGVIVPGVACRQPVAALRENPELAASFKRERERRLELDALKNLDRAGLAALEAQVAKNPDDLELTAKLIYFYREHGQKLIGWNEMVAARRPHLLRLIEKHPESQYTWWPLPQRLDPEGWARARALWMKQVSAPGVTAKRLSRAARFFGISEKPVAEELLLRARQMDPKGPQPRVVNDTYYSSYTASLGELYARAIVGSDDDTLFNVVRSASLQEANGPFATAAKEKLAESKDPTLLRAAGSYLTQNAGGRDGKIGDQEIVLGFDHRALGMSYLDRAAALDPDSETTRRFEAYRKRAAAEERLSALAREKVGGWMKATPEALAALPEPDRIALLPRLATEAIMWAEAIEHDPKIKDDAGRQYAHARAFADQALQLVDKLGAGARTSELRVTGHMARGIVALRDGERAAAAAHLKASTDGVDVNVVVEDHLWSRLTNYLLAAGERETVAQFFDTLSRASSGARFADFAKAIRAGQMPDSYQRQMTAR
jgi:hypothetical protein